MSPSLLESKTKTTPRVQAIHGGTHREDEPAWLLEEASDVWICDHGGPRLLCGVDASHLQERWDEHDEEEQPEHEPEGGARHPGDRFGGRERR